MEASKGRQFAVLLFLFEVAQTCSAERRGLLHLNHF